MTRLLIAAAAAVSLAACHNRNEERTGAAPQRADTASAGVAHVIDSTRTGPPGTAGRPGNATVTVDSVLHDSTAAKPDTSMGDQAPTSVPQDTLGPRTSVTDSAKAGEAGPDTAGTYRQ